ncbi:pyridoxal phosphate-dependent aminotransferase [Bordetella bronchiseptica]|uniref:Aminotransferase n=1 Tax=Bordetella bronchiseptica (strain ATCC BAA-588 / NCTC 13252 / RB50) TaxID=257310 RepID=A0A0H3LHU7_BORBR|nr:pyridoxal phosphate-dependent aminotransferase [Bordetella bronchiseptica]KAK68212.1 aminotransferase, class I/II [Bordetella bronchiseptica 980-2]AMG87214.1 pyridoxal phosphate-dependent aminotransferase [Bordetella bronchiseptica]KCV47228.1 aminotransferase, class I/II [Bordetella bronchiseptica 3E44]KCV55023.1 aminotransferase, class I/II [Bordetella bronchiseptica 980]KDB82345.1 aminotransferase, class I/II [Bordetella bronchiseptica D756]
MNTIYDSAAVAAGRRVAARMARVTTSKIYLAIAKVADMQAQGMQVASLTAGEPDFDTPAHVIEAAVQAMRGGDTHYTPVRGSLAMREAVRQKFQRENGLAFRDEEVMVGTGSKQVIANALAVTLETGDEVLLPVPYWAAYTGMVYAAGGVPTFVGTRAEDGYKLTPQALRAALGPRTRWVILNTPSNPSGLVYGSDELRALGEVLRERPDVLILTDEIYEHLNYTAEPPASLRKLCPDLAERIVVVNGVSKAYAMTGWRLGFAGGPADIIEAMANLQAQTTLAPCSISQAAAVAALNGPRESIDAMAAAYRRRRDLVMQIAGGQPGVRLQRPDGAFYAMLDLSEALAGGERFRGDPEPDQAFCEWLLETRHVAAVPGSVFGAPGSVRISFATDEQTIERGLTGLLDAAAHC